MSNDWQTPEMEDFFQILVKIDNLKDMKAFMRDVATISELKELSLRWEAVGQLDQKTPYRQIAKNTGLSTATVSRIAFWLNNGEGGYKNALKHHHALRATLREDDRYCHP